MGAFATPADVLVTPVDAIILTLVLGYSGGWVSAHVKNTGGSNALNTFVAQRQFKPGGDWFDWLSGTDWATATTRLSPSSVSPATLAAGASAWFDLNPGAAYAVRFKATTSVAAGTTVSMSGGENNVE